MTRGVLGQVSPSQERMSVALEEMTDLKGVWSELARVWEQIDELKEKPWLSVAPRKVTILFQNIFLLNALKVEFISEYIPFRIFLESNIPYCTHYCIFSQV